MSLISVVDATIGSSSLPENASDNIRCVTREWLAGASRRTVKIVSRAGEGPARPDSAVAVQLRLQALRRRPRFRWVRGVPRERGRAAGDLSRYAGFFTPKG